ncbi:MAG: hypothetical protein B6245_19615 [Desulfobacteraceae bacterium 4572_88]|nr:MAG: hypothetical protein B6245_19615 [Desulfobacteraceae bacterium 4572_88]
MATHRSLPPREPPEGGTTNRGKFFRYFRSADFVQAQTESDSEKMPKCGKTLNIRRLSVSVGRVVHLCNDFGRWKSQGQSLVVALSGRKHVRCPGHPASEAGQAQGPAPAVRIIAER